MVIYSSFFPARVNQLPKVSEPHDFIHSKETGGKGNLVEKLVVMEEGADNFNLNTSTKFQKYLGKKSPYYYKGFNHRVDPKTDTFLDGLRKEEKEKFDEECDKYWAKKKEDCRLYHKEDRWYMILASNEVDMTWTGGKTKVALYQDYDDFERVRDEEFEREGAKWSYKGAWFDSLSDARNYIQMARDEEGAYWEWPRKIPVYWREGPLTESDLTQCPEFNMEEEE